MAAVASMFRRGLRPHGARLSDAEYHRLLTALVVVVALYGFATLRLSPDRIVPGTDAPQYDIMARNLAEGRGFALATEPPFAPTVYREPGYPLFTAALYRLSGNDVQIVAGIQVVLLALTAAFSAHIGAELFGRAAGLLGGLLVGFNPQLSYLAGQLLSETLFTFLVAATLWLALRARASRRGQDYLLVGLTVGLATMVRAIGGVLALPLLGLLLLTGGGLRLPTVLARTALLLGGVAIVVAPWVARNDQAIGRPVLTARSSVVLIRRAPRAAEPASRVPEWLVASAWVAFNPLSQVVYPISRFQWGPKPEDNLIWDFHVNDSVRYTERYDPVCRASPDWEACATGISLAFLRKYPLQYIAQSGLEFVKLHFAPLPNLKAGLHNGTIWLAFAALAVLLARRRLTRPRVLILGMLAAYVAVSIAVDAQVRYVVPVLPIYGPLAGAAVFALTRWAGRYRSALTRTAAG